jgi:hypothetical protein
MVPFCRSKVEMSAFPQSPWHREDCKIGQNSLVIPLITGRARIAAWRRQGRIFNAPKGSLDGWPRCNIMRSEGNGKCHAIRE